MIKIEKENTTPRGGWTYVHPTSGRQFNNSCLWVLRDFVTAHCEANGWGFSEEEFRENVCGHSPYAKCYKANELGDYVSMIAQPIARAIDAVAGTNVAGCGGCEKRRQKLNRLSEALDEVNLWNRQTN